MRASRFKRRAAIAIMAAFVAAMIVAPGHALAVTTLDYEPTKTINPVADNITRLNVSKLEKGARDYVKGAHMAIFEKETGKLVTEWVTDGSAHEVARNTDDPNRGALNIDVVYILRELEAPKGYKKAADVEFVIHSDDFNTTGEILKGSEDGNADSEEIRGSGTEQAFVINLYDEAVVTTEEVQTRERKIDREEQDKIEVQDHVSLEQNVSERKKAFVTPQTGDPTTYLPIVALVIAGLILIIVAVRRR